MEIIGGLVQYLAFVLVEGDWLNDWLTHLPIIYQPLVRGIGQAIAMVLGLQ